MSSPALQAKAQALHARLDVEIKTVIDDIDRSLVRPIARQAYVCVVQCYDKAGKTGSSQHLEQCSRQCQLRHQQASAMVQDEIGNFQNRLNRATMQCNDEATDMMTPNMQNDPSKMKKVEDIVLKCLSNTVDNHIKSLTPMRKRVAQQLDGLK